MNKKHFSAFISLALFLAASAPVFAAGGGALETADINIRDTAAIQRGAKLFVNYCLSCHSASYMRYNRLAEDLELDEDLVMQNLVFADVKIGETMDIAMEPEAAADWFGKTPPDLSLIARSRGADWLYTYLKTFYQDENGHWNNLVLPNAAMPHVMWQLQGIQKPIYATHDGHDVIDHLTLAKPGLQSPEEYGETVHDLVTFLEYLSEPAKLKRKNVGVWVLLFLTLFTLIAYLLKAEYWRDVH
ncbi:MAG: cytochrome c1 [Xanthomonadales bacterium]|nr:cytochrome c1 [Gammaproteobacteria bacterium]NND58035.1 cytochrome c1 [Xanthomonadales bacterium]NNK52132.1 cytochrome c1 [Xanthomonadales bacterium]